VNVLFGTRRMARRGHRGIRLHRQSIMGASLGWHHYLHEQWRCAAWVKPLRHPCWRLYGSHLRMRPGRPCQCGEAAGRPYQAPLYKAPLSSPFTDDQGALLRYFTSRRDPQTDQTSINAPFGPEARISAKHRKRRAQARRHASGHTAARSHSEEPATTPHTTESLIP
jgi:hypothetical protein